MPQHTEFEIDDMGRTLDGNFLFKEPIVLFAIICLSLSNGMNLAVQNITIERTLKSTQYQLLSLSATAIPMIGVLFFAFVSEVHGRKPVFIALFTLSILTNILFSLPWQESINYSLPVHGFLRGGIKTMSTLAITEYCCPKHRFTYMLADSIILHTMNSLTSILLDVEPRSYPYVLSFQIVLGLVCLISVCKWPESPYWLASKGKLEESRTAFFWLRGQDGRKELKSVMEERRSPGPLKLYWMSFFVAIATMSVSIFTNLVGRFWLTWASPLPKYYVVGHIIRSCSSIIIASLIAVVSYFVKRKVLFLLVSGISFVFSYGIAVWMHVDPTVDEPTNQLFHFVFFICDIISTYGPIILSSVLSIEIIPFKYNTHMACVAWLSIYIVYFPFMSFFWRTFSDFESSHAHLPILTTLSLVGVIVYFCCAPETKDKTLLEIQKMYTPELGEANPKEEHKIVTHM